MYAFMLYANGASPLYLTGANNASRNRQFLTD